MPVFFFRRALIIYVTLWSLILGVACCQATTLVLSEQDDLIGEMQFARPLPGETLDDLGRRYGMGHNEMVNANPGMDSRQLLSAQMKVVIPSQFIMPNVPRVGIVINLPEYRLYFFSAEENVVRTYPVGIGREGWDTPMGDTVVIAKEINPIWRPSQNLLSEASKNGLVLPERFPSNAANPLGKYALRLKWPSILIHGTNDSNGIGMKVSAGCIRMLPDDMEELFALAPIGTKVKVINQPLKTGQHQGESFLQVYPSLNEKNNVELKRAIQKKLMALNVLKNNSVTQEINRQTGLVRKI